MSSHTEFLLQIMFQTLNTDPTTQNKVLYHTPQNHSTVTTYIHTKFYLPTVFQREILTPHSEF